MAFDYELCAGCPLDGLYEPLESRGADGARYLVITEVPSQKSGRENRLMSKFQSELLREKFDAAGIDTNDVRFTPACHCAYDVNEHVNKVKTAAHKHCRAHLLAEVQDHDPELLIPLGAAAATQVHAKPTKINSVRGQVKHADELGKPSFALMSPTVVVMYPQNAPVFDADVATLARTINADYDIAAAASQMVGDYQFVEDLQFLIDEDAEVTCFDTENTGLRYYQGGVDVRSYLPKFHKGSSLFQPKFQILTMQFTTSAGKGYMLVWDHPERPIPEERKPIIRNQLRKLLCKPERIVVGQNIKYDNVSLWMTEGIRFRIGGDTLLLATLLDENMTEKNLDVLTKIHVPEMAGYADVFNNKYDKSRMWEVPLDEMLHYGCGDTDAGFRLYHKLEAEVMEDERLWAHYCHVTIAGLNAFAGLETRGMYIDEDIKLANFKQTMQISVAEQEAALLHQIPRKVKQDVVAAYQAKNKKATAEEALSFTRGEFIKEVLFNHPRGFRLVPKVFTKSTRKLNDESLREPSVSSKDHLPYFFEDCPFTQELAEFQKDRVLLNTNVIKFEENYIRGGKVRPTYHLHKAVTGRSSSDDPNGQNYPKRSKKAKAYREMFVPPEGYFVVEADLSQAELRIAACMANDKTMIEIYNQGKDIHIATAMIVLGVNEAQWEALPKAEKKVARQKAKAVNFGFLYGMGWRKFISYAKTDYNVEFTEAEAQRIRKGFFTKYKSLANWHDRMREFAKDNKYVRSFSGRIRHLPMIDSPEDFVQQEAGRQAINSPVQEFGSSLGVMAQGRLNEEIDPEYLQVVGFIHDAIVVYVKKEYLDWGMRTLKTYMQTNPLEEWFGTRLKVPIVADVGFGLSLGDVHECEGFSLDKPFNYREKLLDPVTNRPVIFVPPQKIPPNSGRLTRSPYTTPDDLEDENVSVAPMRRVRRMRGVATVDAVKRMTRSSKQMEINRRNHELKKQATLVARVQRRTRPTAQ